MSDFAYELRRYIEVPKTSARHPDPERARLGQIPDDHPAIVDLIRNMVEDIPGVRRLAQALAGGGRMVKKYGKLWILDRRGKAVGYVDGIGGFNQIADVPLDQLEMSESGKSEALVADYAQRSTRAPMIHAHGPRFPGDTWLIINGHHRYLAAKRRGDKTIRVDASIARPSGTMARVPSAGSESGIPDNHARFVHAMRVILARPGMAKTRREDRSTEWVKRGYADALERSPRKRAPKLDEETHWNHPSWEAYWDGWNARVKDAVAGVTGKRGMAYSAEPRTGEKRRIRNLVVTCPDCGNWQVMDPGVSWQCNECGYYIDADRVRHLWSEKGWSMEDLTDPYNRGSLRGTTTVPLAGRGKPPQRPWKKRRR